MTFNSYVFILVFLPCFAVLYFILSRFGNAFSKGALIAGGAVFYLAAGKESAAVLGISIAVNLCLNFLILKAAEPKIRKTLLIASVLLNVLLLIRFKYFNFLAETFNSFFPRKISLRELILPLGISFFTFHQIMFAVSLWRGEIGLSIPDYLAYILYFPKMIMGPLMEPADFLTLLNDPGKKKPDPVNIAAGLKLFSIGLFKKMVLADTFAKAVDWGFARELSALTSADLLLVMLFYSFQIYFDFSGYSDMAVGVSKMINITLPINFDMPYKAFSIRSFWNRWHISLTNFLTKYIYIPLGGNRKGTIRTYVNILTVFLVSGIWHGANLTFLLWGCLHGLLQILERIFRNILDKLPRIIRGVCTFLTVSLLWLLFRSETIGQWREMLAATFRFRGWTVSKELYSLFALPEQSLIFDTLHLNHLDQMIPGFGMILFAAAALLISLLPESAYRRSEKLNWVNMIFCAFLFIWGFMCLSSESVFVYFNF